ncbi:hypothetical protein BC833DRAFT_595190, partial [Globomyces pollinis-pini]
MKSKAIPPELPFEVISEVLKRIPKSHLSVTMRVNKAWHLNSSRVLYRNIMFTSVNQRDKFFSCLKIMKPELQITANPPKITSAATDNSGNPPPVIIRRRSSYLRQKQISFNAKFILKLDFGLRPRHLLPVEPELPNSKAVLPSPKSKMINSFELARIQSPVNVASSSQDLYPTRSSIVTRSSTVHMNAIRNVMTVDAPIPGIGLEASHEDLRIEPINSTPNTSSPVRIQLEPTSSPTKLRQRNRGLTVSTESPVFSDSEGLDSPYGSWSHRLISPLLSHISRYIPHLKDLSICGCHVNNDDFIILLDSLTQLEKLDISYSTLKTKAVQRIGYSCRDKLRELNVSGIFKLGRNKPEAIYDISAFCKGLNKIVMNNCPEIYDDVLIECKELCNNRIQFYSDDC